MWDEVVNNSLKLFVADRFSGAEKNRPLGLYLDKVGLGTGDAYVYGGV